MAVRGSGRIPWEYDEDICFRNIDRSRVERLVGRLGGWWSDYSYFSNDTGFKVDYYYTHDGERFPGCTPCDHMSHCGMTFPVPQNASVVLERMYGPNWHIAEHRPSPGHNNGIHAFTCG